MGFCKVVMSMLVLGFELRMLSLGFDFLSSEVFAAGLPNQMLVQEFNPTPKTPAKLP